MGHSKSTILDYLPLAKHKLQYTLEGISLRQTIIPTPSPNGSVIVSSLANRRSQTWPKTGFWARVTPLPVEFPFTFKSLTGKNRDEIEDVDQLDVDQLFQSFDEFRTNPDTSSTDPAICIRVSVRRQQAFKPSLLSISQSCMEDCLPELHKSISTNELQAFLQGEISLEKAGFSELADVLSGTAVVYGLHRDSDGNHREYGPWSTRYAGHQFGTWAGQLGDGRAISICEDPTVNRAKTLLETTRCLRLPISPSSLSVSSAVETETQTGGRQEIQLKGSGRTPFSRSADGLATFKSVLREYICSEAEARQMSFFMLGGSSSNADLGSPQGPQKDLERLRVLAEWVAGPAVLDIKREPGKPFTLDLIREVGRRNAKMVAAWQVYGFCHGVINTDNVSVLGLTIDYGPWAFMEGYDPFFICNSDDAEGRYDFRKQPTMILFAIRCLFNSLSELIEYELEHDSAVPSGWLASQDDQSTSGVKTELENVAADIEKWTMTHFKEEYDRLFARRLGLDVCHATTELVESLLSVLRSHELDFNHFLRALSHFRPSKSSGVVQSEKREKLIKYLVSCIRVESRRPEAKRDVVEWLARYENAIKSISDVGSDAAMEQRSLGMKSVNPRFTLRRWVIDELAAKVMEADEATARSIVNNLLQLATHPFEAYGEDADHDAQTRVHLNAQDAATRRLCQVSAI